MRHYLILSLLLFSWSVAKSETRKPNVLFIAIDDLNDWIGCMKGHPDAKTPNLDKLAASGVLFTNAHCPAPACNPSRTAVMTGISPHRSGLYDNGQSMRELLPDADILPNYFRKHGYRAMGSGKILHYFIDAHSWDEYYPKKESENPFPRTLYPDKRPVSLPRAGPWQYIETDWGALDATDKEFGGDYLVSEWVAGELSKTHEKPFFLACGIYRPHEPWFVPQKYFDPFPIDSIQLPPGYKEDDLDDLPPSGKKAGPNRYFEHIKKHDQWKQAVQAYLASIHFADAMLGRVIDALETGPNKENTIVVLWSDHGWHLGEKEHWQKYTGWRACTRVPLIIEVPEGLSVALPSGTREGSRCDKPVNLLSLFPTLTELCGIPKNGNNHGPSLLPLLTNPESAEWNHVSTTWLSQVGSFAISDVDFRYIHYTNGDEELYQISDDPYEWNNLAENREYAEILKHFRSMAPTDYAEKVEASFDSLPSLSWVSNPKAPPSNPDGATFNVAFSNQTQQPVELFWIDRNGKPKSYGKIPPGKIKEQNTRPGAVWQIQTEKGTPLGYFKIGDRRAKAIIPKSINE